MQQTLCSHLAHLWATSHFAPRYEGMASPREQGLCRQLTHLLATPDSPPPRFEAMETP